MATIGFDGSVTEADWAKLHEVQGRLQWHHGVTTGLIASPGAGPRQVAVTAGVGYAPGVRADQDAATVTVAANNSSSNRLDWIVLDFNWDTNTATIDKVQGGAVLPTLTQVAGVRWQLPLASVTVRPGVTTIAAGDITIRKPIPREAEKLTGVPGWDEQTMGANAGTRTLTTFTVPDPGWPYILDIDSQVRLQATNGYVELATVVNTDTVNRTASDWLGVNDYQGQSTVYSSAPSKTLTGTSTVKLQLSWIQVQAGTTLTIRSSFYGALHVLRLPAKA